MSQFFNCRNKVKRNFIKTTCAFHILLKNHVFLTYLMTYVIFIDTSILSTQFGENLCLMII